MFRPTGQLGDRLDALTSEVVEVAGADHWPTGSHGAAHMTIRALEPHTAHPVSQDRLRSYVAAIRGATADMRSVRLEFRGLAVSPGTVMACAISEDGVADELRRRLGVELEKDGWLENEFFATGRDPIWYVTLVNFARPLADAASVVDWVTAKRHLEIGVATFSQIDICRFDFDGTRMVPQVVSSIGLGVSGVA